LQPDRRQREKQIRQTEKEIRQFDAHYKQGLPLLAEEGYTFTLEHKPWFTMKMGIIRRSHDGWIHISNSINVGGLEVFTSSRDALLHEHDTHDTTLEQHLHCQKRIRGSTPALVIMLCLVHGCGFVIF